MLKGRALDMTVRKPESPEKWLFFLSLAQAVCLSVCALNTVSSFVYQTYSVYLYDYIPDFLIFVFAIPHLAAMISRCFYFPYLCFAGIFGLTVFCGIRIFRSKTRPPMGWILCLVFLLLISAVGIFSVERMFAMLMSV